MANLTTQLFGAFSNPETDPQGTDSRTQGDENFRAIASSLKLTFPNLDDIACTKSGAQLNDTTEASASETISGPWTFVSNIVASLAGAISAYALRIIRNGNDVFYVEQGGRVVIDIDATAGGRTALEISDQGGSRSVDIIRVTSSADAELFRVDQNGKVIATSFGPVASSGAVSGTDISASGTLDVDGTITTNVPDGTPAFEFANAQSGAGLTATAEFIPCRLWDGTIAYLRLWT